MINATKEFLMQVFTEALRIIVYLISIVSEDALKKKTK